MALTFCPTTLVLVIRKNPGEIVAYACAWTFLNKQWKRIRSFQRTMYLPAAVWRLFFPKRTERGSFGKHKVRNLMIKGRPKLPIYKLTTAAYVCISVIAIFVYVQPVSLKLYMKVVSITSHKSVAKHEASITPRL